MGDKTIHHVPAKNPKRGFYGLNMKFSMDIDYTRKISKFPPWERGEWKGEILQTFRTFSKKISKIVPKIEIFFEKVCKMSSFHSPLSHGGNLDIFLM